MEQIFTEKQAAEHIGWRIDAMRVNRRKGSGPAHYRVGRKVLYRMCDLEAFLAARRVEERRDVPEAHVLAGPGAAV
jgi:hypothetical protein